MIIESVFIICQGQQGWFTAWFICRTWGTTNKRGVKLIASICTNNNDTYICHTSVTAPHLKGKANTSFLLLLLCSLLSPTLGVSKWVGRLVSLWAAHCLLPCIRTRTRTQFHRHALLVTLTLRQSVVGQQLIVTHTHSLLALFVYFAHYVIYAARRADTHTYVHRTHNKKTNY